ncbi:MAG TPA: exodeoxyribonuclease VII large subunit, partial [Sedimentisphaerales bacterium]|nr:exodeoxyribonuclease VII large subunit [Sedimentisphaerales bacterium]
LEDLWAFNEEVLARAIFRSKIPVVSAVGHEIDTTIADLVADVRASTPTKAGVVTVPDMYEVLDRLAVMQRRLAGWAKTALRLAKQHLETVLASEVFRKPFSLVTTRQQLLDETEMRVSNTIRYQLAELGQKVHLLAEQVRRIEPHRLLRECLVTVYNLQNRARMAAQQVIGGCRVTVSTAAGRLAALNPKSVLQRGYSITTNAATGRIVRLLEDAAVADTLITELADENLIESKVTKKQNKAKRS